MIEEMTEEQKEVYKNLVNPDTPTESKYNWDFDYQRNILSMLMHDRNFLIQCVELIKPKYFIDRAHVLFCNIIFDYFEKYKQIPNKTVMINEIQSRSQNTPASYYFLAELNSTIQSYLPGLESREHLLDKIVEFAKHQSLKLAMSDSLDIMKKNDENKWDKISDILKKALTVDRSFDHGLDYFQEIDSRFERMTQAEKKGDLFTTGFPTIDQWLGGGMSGGEIAAFMALPGVGKSIFLIKAAIENLRRGKKVLFISLEMSQDKLANRFDSMLSNYSIKKYDTNGDGGFSINPNWVMYDKNITSAKETIFECAKDYDDRKRLLIKQYPAGEATTDTFRAYLSQMALHGFKPDLIVVDYLGEMKDHPNIPTHESKQKSTTELRALAVETNTVIFSAIQANRGGRDQQEDDLINESAIAQSFGVLRVFDNFYILSVNKKEQALSIGRLFVAKHRNGLSRKVLPFKLNPDTLDISELHWDTYKEMLHNQVATTEVKLDKIFRDKNSG